MKSYLIHKVLAKLRRAPILHVDLRHLYLDSASFLFISFLL